MLLFLEWPLVPLLEGRLAAFELDTVRVVGVTRSIFGCPID
jgi:hypothetical protein